MKHFDFTAESTHTHTIYTYDNITMHLYAEDSVTRCFDILYISNFDLNVFYYLTLPNNLEPCNYFANTVIEPIDKIKYLKIIMMNL